METSSSASRRHTDVCGMQCGIHLIEGRDDEKKTTDDRRMPSRMVESSTGDIT